MSVTKTAVLDVISTDAQKGGTPYGKKDPADDSRT